MSRVIRQHRSAAKAGVEGSGTRHPSSHQTLGSRIRGNTGLFGMVLMTLVTPAPALAQTQAGMTARAGTAYTRADAAMNAQWRRTQAEMKRRGARYAGALLASQRAWLAYRDAHCRIAGMEFEGGSAQPMAVAQCRADLTEERTRQLKELTWQR